MIVKFNPQLLAGGLWTIRNSPIASSDKLSAVFSLLKIYSTAGVAANRKPSSNLFKLKPVKTFTHYSCILSNNKKTFRATYPSSISIHK